MEPISAIDVFTQRNPAQPMKYIQMRPAVPPFKRPIVATLYAISHPTQGRTTGLETNPRLVSHVDIKIIEKPKMDTNRKFR